MKTIKINLEDNTSKKNNNFINGYGQFPYIIIKNGYAKYIQIPIQFNKNNDQFNFPGTHLKVQDEILVKYRYDKKSELHESLIKHCKELKINLEKENNSKYRVCLVEGPNNAVYFEGNEIITHTSIPKGGFLLSQDLKVIGKFVSHHI